MSLSLVPYEGSREVVLRNSTAVVLRDPLTRQLTIRNTAATPATSTAASATDLEIEHTQCPTCHRPLSHDGRAVPPTRGHHGHDAAPAEAATAASAATTFISPGYFRMLQHTYAEDDPQSLASARRSIGSRSHDGGPSSTQITRLVATAVGDPLDTPVDVGSRDLPEAEFVTSSPAIDGPAAAASHGIRREAFSPNYFARFFVEEKELGRGGKGVVLLVRHELDGVPLGQFACKRVPVGDDHAWLEKVLIEVQLLQGLSHPNLVSYRHVWLEDVQLHRFGPSVPCAYILQQYCNAGDLLHYVGGAALRTTNEVAPGESSISHNERLKDRARRRSKGEQHFQREDANKAPLLGASGRPRRLAFDEIYSFFKDITNGLAHLHASNYIHRDLKPSNCLLHRDGGKLRCLISDFGEVQAENAVRTSTGGTGTISYCAPEVLKCNAAGQYGNFTTKSDIFSLGMILYFLCFGRLPYRNADAIREDFEDADRLRAEISDWTGFGSEKQERPDLPSQLFSFLTQLLSLNPADRPHASDILHAIRTEKHLEKPAAAKTAKLGSVGLGGRRHGQDAANAQPRRERRMIQPFAKLETSEPSESGSVSPSEQLLHERNEQRLPSPKTPLLMPPPTSMSETMQHYLQITKHCLLQWLQRNVHVTFLLIRTGVFLLKMTSILKPCSPLAAREIVWYPLAGIAAVELGLGRALHYKLMLILAGVHVMVLLAMNAFGGICERHVWPG